MTTPTSQCRLPSHTSGDPAGHLIMYRASSDPAVVQPWSSHATTDGGLVLTTTKRELLRGQLCAGRPPVATVPALLPGCGCVRVCIILCTLSPLHDVYWFAPPSPAWHSMILRLLPQARSAGPWRRLVHPERQAWPHPPARCGEAARIRRAVPAGGQLNGMALDNLCADSLTHAACRWWVGLLCECCWCCTWLK